MSRPCTCRNCCHFAALPGSDYCDGCERIAATAVATPADALADRFAMLPTDGEIGGGRS